MKISLLCPSLKFPFNQHFEYKIYNYQTLVGLLLSALIILNFLPSILENYLSWTRISVEDLNIQSGLWEHLWVIFFNVNWYKNVQPSLGDTIP